MSYSTTTTKAELAFTAPISSGAKKMPAQRVQEWLCFHGFRTMIDADYGPATVETVKKFQTAKKLPVTGTVDARTWDLLIKPLADLLALTIKSTLSRDKAVLEVAKAHLATHPIELGGQNRGPWVRVYTDGKDGDDWLWCAAFVSFVMKQACFLTGAAIPITGSVSCDTLAAQAKAAGRFVAGGTKAPSWSTMGVCQIFLVRRTSSDWTHTGFSFAGGTASFSTIEGNSDESGSSNGHEVCERTRGLSKKDYITLL